MLYYLQMQVNQWEDEKRPQGQRCQTERYSGVYANKLYFFKGLFLDNLGLQLAEAF